MAERGLLSRSSRPGVWVPCLSALAATWGVKDIRAEYPMSTFRPTDSENEAVALAGEMNAVGFEGDGLDYVPRAAATERSEEGTER